MSDSVPDERLYADVILPLATPAMTFSVPEHLAGELAEGSCVIVQLGARKYYTGVVRRIHGDRPVAAKVKPVERTVGDRPAATSVQLRLWDWLAFYYMCPLGLVMRAAVPAALKSGGLSVQEAVDGSYSPPQESFRRVASVGPQRGGFACRSRFAVEGPGAVPGDDRVSGADRPARFRRPRNSCRVVC